MTRRARIVAWSFGALILTAAGAVAAALSLLNSDWGQERVRRVLVARATAALAGHGRLVVGRFAGGLGGRFSADSIVVLDDHGTTVLSVSHLEVDVPLAEIIRGNIRITRALLVRPYMFLEQKDSTWNISRLFAPRPRAATTPRSAVAIALDSAELRDGRVVLVQPDSLASLPGLRREFSHLQLVLGPTQLVRPGAPGGSARLGRLAVDVSRPPVSLRDASGSVRWWQDSLLLELPTVRLPATHAAVRGSIAWALPGGARLNLRVHADTVALEDVAWTSSLVPKHGDGSGDLHVRNAPGRPRDLEYALTNLDIRATRSHLSGGVVVTPGRRASVTRIALDLQPLDLDLVRELFGEGVPKREWQGAVTGTVRGAGGPLDAIRIDSADVSFEDARVRGARSHLMLAGTIDAQSKPSALHDMALQLVELDVRSLGVIARAADSLHGALTGAVTLDGPVNDLAFSGLSLTHVDGNRERSHVSGEGRIATDQESHWLDATLRLDTLALATLARGRTTLPLQGSLRGTLELHATRDTMTIDARVRAGDGRATFAGRTRLDSSTTWLRGAATLHAIDPRVFITRKDIPVLKLDGSAEVELDGRNDGHVDLTLDTTSVIGASRILLGRVRAGVDSAGFHVDTAELRARDFRMSARGRLARTGVTHDTLRFAVAFDSLTPLRALLLDSTGTARADSLRGAFGAGGTIVGSLDTLALAADFSVRDARWNDLSVRLATGRAEMGRLPAAGTGTVTLTADGVTTAGYTATRVQAHANVRDGREAQVTLDAASGDTLRARAVALVRHGGDTTRVALDSLDVALGGSRWRLDRPSRVEFTRQRIVLDSVHLSSARGATVVLRATVPDSGAVDGELRVERFGTEDAAFTGKLPPDVEGRARADVRLTGTRDAPRLAYSADLDSLRVGDRVAPSFALRGSYDARLARLDVRGTREGRESVVASADLPLDLSLRSVGRRKLDGPLSIRVHADSVALAGFSAFLPQVEALGGTIWADDTIHGTWSRTYWDGFVRVRDGAFDLPKIGTVARQLSVSLALRGDSVRIVEPLRVIDGDDPRDFLTVSGALVLAPAGWLVDLKSSSRQFRVIDDPRIATIEASWNVGLSGLLRQPFLEGDVTLPTATFVMGQARRIRVVRDPNGPEEKPLPIGMPIIKALHVTLGNDVRLKSKDANVGLTGELDVAGDLSNPYAAGEVSANRGTYRVDLGVIKRTFRVDSGTVRVAGTPQMPASLDIWTSYVVRSSTTDDRTIIAHLTGASDAPRLELSSSDAGTAVAQSEIISYLLFGTPSFALDRQGQSTVSTATAALVPSIGGLLEGVLGTLMPFLSSLQVTTVAGSGPQNLTTNPLDGLLNSFALTAGRQIGSDTFLNLSGGVCRGSRLSSTQSAPGWFGISAEYRPRTQVGGAISMDPGSSPCNHASGRLMDIYQLGFDLFRDWRF
ncbi:MAG: translocation/assembly module TamB domain-containing protein [Gemmatimonadales bacterium]